MAQDLNLNQRLIVNDTDGVRVTGITSGSYLEISGNLPGYTAGQYPVLKSGGTIHFAVNGAYSAYLEANDTYFGILDSNTVTQVLLRTNGISYLNGGKVGIGTSSPGSQLTVAGSAIAISNGWTGTHDILFVGGSPSSTGGANSTAARIRSTASAPSGAATGDLLFTVNRGDAFVDALYIKETGNVGIGTTSPDGKLNIKASYTSSSTITNDASDYAVNVDFIGTNGSIASPQYGAHFAIRDSNGAAVAAINGVDQGASGATGLSFLTGDVNGLSDRLHITYSGNVGIGTTSPQKKLDVRGGYFMTNDGTGKESAFVQGGTGYAYFGNLNAGPAAFGNSEDWTTLVVDGGKVGIGTTSPSYKLDVNGDFRATTIYDDTYAT